MKKKLIILLCSLSVLLFTSCLSLLGGLSPFAASSNKKYSYDGTINTATGYEIFDWGTSYSQIKDAGYPLTNVEQGTFYFCYIGKTEKYNSRTKDITYSRAEVGGTKMFFAYKKLYYVIDSFLNTPSMEYLHQRYGDFDEQNLASEKDVENGIKIVYANNNKTSLPNTHTLEIRIQKNGRTEVHIFDPYTAMSVAYPSIEILDEEYTSPSDYGMVKPHTWNCYATYDVKKDVIHYTFLNQNKQGKYLFVGYSKNLKNPVLSSVDSGICWRRNTSGTYEIKIGTDIQTRKFSSDDWECLYNNKKYTYTCNSGESAREMLTLFLENDVISIRHNDEVANFKCNGNELLEVMDNFAISWDEIDYAMANEEF